ncbi:hypothetical protein N7G274_001301 [Stereocaulon virgatum]|uniref:Peptidase A2 domain-containing protein n=1 Tax=Stereocaulon virgatum TaxID=373712 RepID=A0ABR4AR53_9LECA
MSNEHKRPYGRSSNASQDKLPASSVDELKTKALYDLDGLNALSITLKSIRSWTTPTHHKCRSDAGPLDVMFIKEKLHRSFISTYMLGVQAHEQHLCDQTRWIFLALFSALVRYQTLFDSQKRAPLLKIANIFQDLGHPWECEYILERMTRSDSPSTPAFSEDPCLRLAESLSKTSATIGSVLTTLWKDTVGDDDPPRHLVVPPLQRAAAISNAGVASALLAHRNGVDPRAEIYDEHYYRVVDFLGTPQIRPRLGIDDRDLHGRTALFVAASHGSDQCCLTLLSGLADPNSRDHRGHTVLEAAASGGHLEVMKILIGVGANVNPQLLCCSSSPLQAALERDNPNKELVDHLLDQGADISVLRPSDNRTALEIANWKGHTELANAIRRCTPVQSQYRFSLGIQDSAGQNLGVQHVSSQEFRCDWP